MQIELSYINTKHPDFCEAHLVHRAMMTGTDLVREVQEIQKPISRTAERNTEDKENKVRRSSFYILWHLN